jgi:hypothetical protein
VAPWRRKFSRLNVLFICYGTAVEHRSLLNRSGICDGINHCNICLFMQPITLSSMSSYNCIARLIAPVGIFKLFLCLHLYFATKYTHVLIAWSLRCYLLTRQYFLLENITSIYLVLNIFYLQLHMNGIEQHAMAIQALSFFMYKEYIQE